MPKSATYEEQWTSRLSADARRYRVSVKSLVPGKWKLRPRDLRFDPPLVYWAMCSIPDGRYEEKRSWRTVWLAFHESPVFCAETELLEGEAIIVNYEPILSDVLVPGFQFAGTVDGTTPVVEIIILE